MTMYFSDKKKISLLLIILFFLLLIFYKFSSNFIDLIVQQEQNIQNFIFDNFKISIIISISIIILATTLMFPMSPFILLTGFFFDFYYAFAITVLGEAVGAIIVFIYVKWFFKNYFRKKFGEIFKKMELKFNENSFFYLLALRIVGGTPFFIENILPAIFNMRIFPYILGTFFGIMPWEYIIVVVGSGFQI